MNHPSSSDVSWRALALELLRRLAGAAATMSTDLLRTAGAAHEVELFRRGIDGVYFAMCNPGHPRCRLYQALRQAQVGQARALIDDLATLGVDAAIIKGIEVGARHPHALTGVCADVDLLVPVAGIWTAEKVLYGQGYSRVEYVGDAGAWQDLKPPTTYRLQATGYELMPFVKSIRIEGLDGEAVVLARRFPKSFKVENDAVFAVVDIDVHHNILFDFDVAPFLARTVPGAVGTGRALCPADHLWFLIRRYYFEVAAGAAKNLRVLALIAALVGDPGVDWDLVVRNAIEHDSAAPCLYWLLFFHRLGAPAVSERVLGGLRAGFWDSERNWGWQLGRLFGIEEAFPDNLLAE